MDTLAVVAMRRLRIFIEEMVAGRNVNSCFWFFLRDTGCKLSKTTEWAPDMFELLVSLTFKARS
jgi:hypothetical protein